MTVTNPGGGAAAFQGALLGLYGGGAVDGLASGTASALARGGAIAIAALPLSVGSGSVVDLFNFVAGDYPNGALTNFKVRMEIVLGATPPGTVTFAGSLVPITIAGGQYTAGAPLGVVNSAGLAINGRFPFTSAAFNLVDGVSYGLQVVNGGGSPVPAAHNVHLNLLRTS